MLFWQAQRLHASSHGDYRSPLDQLRSERDDVLERPVMTEFNPFRGFECFYSTHVV